MEKLTRASVLRSNEFLALLTECARFLNHSAVFDENNTAKFLAANLWRVLDVIDKDCSRSEINLKDIRKKVVVKVIF